MVLAIILFVLVVLAVILTLWHMPAANSQDDGVRTVWAGPVAISLPIARRQPNGDCCALTQLAVQLHRARVLVLDDPAA